MSYERNHTKFYMNLIEENLEIQARVKDIIDRESLKVGTTGELYTHVARDMRALFIDAYERIVGKESFVMEILTDTLDQANLALLAEYFTDKWCLEQCMVKLQRRN